MNRSEDGREELKRKCWGRGMAIGLALFLPLGVILSHLLHNPGMLGTGTALGICMGIAIGEAMYNKEILGE